MATKTFYLTNSPPDFTPSTVRGAWDVTTGNICRAGQRYPSGIATTRAQACGATGAGRDVLLGRWVIGPLVADYLFTTSDTVAWIAGIRESSVNLNGFYHVHVFATQGQTDTLRGTLLTDSIGGTEFTTTATGRGEGALTLAALQCYAGDYIVVEIGYQSSSNNTTYTSTINYGNVGTTDLTQGNTTVTTRPGSISLVTGSEIFSLTRAIGSAPVLDASTPAVYANGAATSWLVTQVSWHPNKRSISRPALE